jgi:hypothetical protein
MQDVRSQVQKLWQAANANPDTSGQYAKICEFWQYVQDNIASIDMRQLFTTDIPTLKTHCKADTDWQNMACMLSTSGVVYMRMRDMYHNIGKNMEFLMAQDIFPLNVKRSDLLKKIRTVFLCEGIDVDNLLEPPENYEIRMGRNMIVLTADENINRCSLIEEIYSIGRNYCLPADWQIIKYIPAKRNMQPFSMNINMPDFTTQTITDEDMTYKLVNRELYVRILKNIMWTNPQTIVFNLKRFLSETYGEYLVMQSFDRIHLDMGSPSDYLPFSQFRRNEDPKLLKNVRTCEFCGFSEHNCDISTVDHKKFTDHEHLLPECDHCSYCYDAVCMHALGQTIKRM